MDDLINNETLTGLVGRTVKSAHLSTDRKSLVLRFECASLLDVWSTKNGDGSSAFIDGCCIVTTPITN